MSTTSTRLHQLQAFLQESPEDSFLRYALAKEYEKLGQLETALHHFQQIQSDDPDYVGMYYHLGKLYEKVAQPHLAFQTYKTGMVVAKKLGDQHALSELAGAKLALGDDDDFE